MNKFILVSLIFMFFSYQSNGNNHPDTINSITIKADSPSNTQKQNIDINNSSETSNNVTNCDGNKRAYEFGREMATMVVLRSSSLTNAIRVNYEKLGLEPPFNSSNPCVIKGFDDKLKNIPSPYNKDGKNWRSFK